jgi:hypothetical protein
MSLTPKNMFRLMAIPPFFAAGIGGFAWAQSAPSPASSPDAATLQLPTIQVGGETYQGGVAARIDPGIGANSYTLGQQQLDNAPGGSNAPFAQQLYRLPGVVQDSYGEIHIRAEHGNAQYQINGIMLPEGLEGFGQQFDT